MTESPTAPPVAGTSARPFIVSSTSWSPRSRCTKPGLDGDLVFINSTGDEEERHTADPSTWDGHVSRAVLVRRGGFPHHRRMTHEALREVGPLVADVLDAADRGIRSW